MSPVIVYSKANCMQCNFTKKFLEDKNVPFEVRNIDENEAYLEEVKAFGFTALPVVVAEGHDAFSGFRPDVLENLV